MKTYINIIVINGIEYSNIVKSKDYKEALEIQRKRKSKSVINFKGRFVLSE